MVLTVLTGLTGSVVVFMFQLRVCRTVRLCHVLASSIGNRCSFAVLYFHFASTVGAVHKWYITWYIMRWML